MLGCRDDPQSEIEVQMTATLDAQIDGDSRSLARNHRLRRAVHRHKAISRRGIQERLFTFAFSGLVYPQIWEDPVVDLEALELKDGEHLIAIASGGCNILSYVTAVDLRVTGLDLNPAHVALNKLKLTAARHLPDYATFYRFFAKADAEANVAAYKTYLASKLDAVTRKYWESRDRLGRRRIGYFSRNVYRQGLLGRFISAGHLFARVHRSNPKRILKAKSRDEQRKIFNEEIAPLFEKRHIRWLMDKPTALFGLGIPPSQFEALKGSESQMATVLKARLERLACGFDLSDNYFAWQAFGRRYARDGKGPLPPYLAPGNYETLKARSGNIGIVHASFTEHLASLPEKSCDAYVLLDAQDWMTDEQLTALWTEIVRTSRSGARVIFRTAGEETILPGRIPDPILARFTYDRDRCRTLSAKDRSSIYGGFHLYVLSS
jgi:S-adenosylmethionine-diacylglycerol 3-amino-3-carboxypropyl transferase